MYIHQKNVHNTQAASEVVPLIMELFKPTSVLDVGCGIGTWLSIFRQKGVQDITGIDGDYIDRELLKEHLDLRHFVSEDLSIPFNLKRKYDLAISFEVAEHLPSSSAPLFINSLCKHADRILFSAAVPNQGGQNHLNEQWPIYWINLFEKEEFHCYDYIRSLIWDNEKIDWWYKQNILLFTKLEQKNDTKATKMLSVIHPEHFLQKIENLNQLEQQLYHLQNTLRNLMEGRSGIRIALHSLKAAIRNKAKF